MVYNRDIMEDQTVLLLQMLIHPLPGGYFLIWYPLPVLAAFAVRYHLGD